ncbi:L-fuconolactonase [Paenibacillus sp. 1_12]|uniref:amidohydrolase family protein n=1 Tax=Paenibacillus sp. 1_12 TaxID=1566278 RepID=UPI0008F06188|nr:amidohydrolase family protein [Paenibacillus sp. 1_12]SFK95188.1 L-fuconolactonase [Paenibacillus sp. 1_12]
MRIDAHQHYWIISRTDYGWLKPSLGRIYADYMPEHLKPWLERYDFQKTIVVQAAPTSEETEFLLSIAEREATIAGVVGWLDLESNTFEQQWDRFRSNPKFVGLRPMIQDLSSDWILGKTVIRHLKLLADAQFPVDLQANPRHLPYIAKLLEQVPDLRAVVDHLAKPPILEGIIEPWTSQMRQIASFPNVMCKLSGMVPEQLDAPWTQAAIQPYVDVVLNAFGKQRVMFGSDWPVCLFSATYPQVMDLIETSLGTSWTEEELAAVYGDNASRFYRLNE